MSQEIKVDKTRLLFGFMVLSDANADNPVNLDHSDGVSMRVLTMSAVFLRCF